MYLMYCDETNLEPTQNVEFFIYGGLIVPSDACGPLSEGISEVRSQYGFRPEDSLKFRTQSRPSRVAQDQWTAAKAEVIQACVLHQTRFIACLVLHNIAGNDRDRLLDWQINTVMNSFSEKFLRAENDVGVVVLDRIGQQKEYPIMRQKFTRGGSTRSGASLPFTRVVSYSATCDGASHLTSAADIVLGTFGYCVNQRGNVATPRQLFPTISPLIWRKTVGTREYMWGYGLVLSPATVAVAAYQAKYDDLKAHIRSLGGP